MFFSLKRPAGTRSPCSSLPSDESLGYSQASLRDSVGYQSFGCYDNFYFSEKEFVIIRGIRGEKNYDPVFAAAPQFPSLQHQLHGFGNGHEIPLHLRFGDRDGDAFGNLFLESQNHAAPAAQHIAKAHRHIVVFRCVRTQRI